MKINIIILFILIQFLLFSQNNNSFKSIEEINNYIESNWSNKNIRNELYKLALKSMKEYPDNAEIIGRAAFLEYMLEIENYGAEKIAKAYKMNPAHRAIPIWAYNIYLYIAHNDPDKEKSIIFFKKAMEVNKEFIKDGYFYIGYRYESFNPPRYEDAVINYNKAEENGYKDISLFVQRGNCYKNLERYKEAEKDLNKALEINKNHSWAIYILASMRMAQGDTAGWADYLERFLNIKDDDFVKKEDRNVRDVLQYYYIIKLNSLKNAKRHLEYLIIHYPGDKNSESWNFRLEKYINRNITVIFKIKGNIGLSNTVILPVQNSYQKHKSYSFNPKPISYNIYSEAGNTYAKLQYDKVPEFIEITAEISFEPGTMTENGFIYEDKNDNIQKYTESFVDSGVELKPQDIYIKKLVSEIIKDEKDPLKKAQLIHNWIQKNITYKVVFYNSIKEYLENKQGECGGFALIFTSLCREAEIPARRVFSPIFEYPDDYTFGSHETSEFYVKEYGWIPVNNTNDHFGFQTDVLSLWRVNYTDDSKILYPSLRNITVKYKTSKNKLITLIGG